MNRVDKVLWRIQNRDYRFRVFRLYVLRNDGFRRLPCFTSDKKIGRKEMLIVIILLVLLLGGGYFGYNRYGPSGGLGIGGILLLILILWLIFGGGLGNLRLPR